MDVFTLSQGIRSEIEILDLKMSEVLINTKDTKETLETHVLDSKQREIFECLRTLQI